MTLVPYGLDLGLPDKVVARLTRIDGASEGRSRSSYEFDALGGHVSVEEHASWLTSGKLGPGIEALRVLTTPKRFAAVCRTEPEIGYWFIFSFVNKKPKHRGLPVWRTPLGDDGFVALARTWIGEGEKISDDREPHRPPRSLGAAVPSDHVWAEGIKAASVFPLGAIKSRAAVKQVLHIPSELRR